MGKTTIIGVEARQILDSRGKPTVEADVFLEGGFGRAAVPSGASKGEDEALELRDGDKSFYDGEGVCTAVNNIRNFIERAVKGLDAADQKTLDDRLISLEDDKVRKNKMGANAILAVSMAAAKACANVRGIPLFKQLNDKANMLPVPMMNILNGGEHADNNVDIQEFMIVPVCGGCFKEALRAGAEIYHKLKKIIKSLGLGTGLGDEGGFAPNLESNTAALDLIMEAIRAADYEPGRHVFLAMDVAANSLYENNRYNLEGEGLSLSAEELIERVYEPWVENYPIVSIEDPLAEKDWPGWAEVTRRLGSRIQIVGDDVFVTQTAKLKEGFAHKAANAILIKLNQVGTVSETLDTIALAKQHGYAQVVSHRSGETEDSFIADFTVATGCGQIKTGAPARGERTAKYNQLLRIEEILAGNAKYPGLDMYSKYLNR